LLKLLQSLFRTIIRTDVTYFTKTH